MVCQDELTNCKCDSAGSPKVQKHAPFFKGKALVNGIFQDISLTTYTGKFIVLFFYPMDFTFVCPTEIIAFSDRADEFKAINTEIIACSTDSVHTHFAWCEQDRKIGGLGKINFPLLSDKNLAISRDYGVLDEEAGITFRGLFIIDSKGVLRQITINDLSIGRNVDEVLRLVQAIQFADEYGDVCPVNWKPGSKSLKPTQEGLQKYMEDKS